MATKLGMTAALVFAAVFASGCGNMSENFLTTSALPEPPRVDPACGQLAATIDGLRREGVPGKVEKAAAKKYRMKTADLTKAAQLNRANEEFQARCSTTRSASAADSLTGAAAAPKAAAPKTASASASPATPAAASAPAAPTTASADADTEVRTAAKAPAPASAEDAISASASSSP